MKRKLLTRIALLLCVLMAGGGSVWAETVTWAGTTALPGTATVVGDSPITIMASATNAYSNPIRIYASTTITIQADNGYVINSVTLSANSDSYATAAKNATVYPDVTPTVSETNDVTWALSNATTFTFKPSAQTRANSISITYTSASSEPSISANDVNIASGATSGNIGFTVEHPIEGGAISAATSANWLTLGSVGQTIPFTCSANTESTARTATVTLTYTYETNKTVTKDVTITQAAYVNDYATLPFTFDSGKSSLPTGLTQNGLGSNYSSSPYLKFDDTGDYLILKINEAPGTLSYDIKGNSFSSGTFKVQTSADGTAYTDLKTYTELGSTQNESFDLGLNVRYIKWIYTSKVSGNVALGNIVLAERDYAPSITVDPVTVNVDANEHDGTLDLAYANLTINGKEDFDVQFYDAEGEEVAAPDWIEVSVAEQDPQVGEGYVASYYMLENEGAARTAYFKVYALDDELNEVYSELITIKQAAPVVTTTYTLANAIVSGKHYIITNESDAAMGRDKGNNRDAVEIEINDGTTSVLSDAGVYEFVIYGPDADGRYSIYDDDEVTPGYLYAASSGNNYLKTQASNNINGKWSISFSDGGVASIVANGSDNRNVMQYNSGSSLFSCYASASQSPVYLYEKNGEATPTESRTLNEYGYATYCSQNALDFTNAEGVTAWAITGVNGENITFSQIAGRVPAGTGMLLKGAANASVTMTSATGAATAPSGNKLVGTLEPLTITANEYFGLSGNTFVPVNAGTVLAGKALLRATDVPAASRMIFVFEDATGIATVEQSPLNDNRYYNLSGQRVDSPKKGMYIVNGKKVVVK